MVPCVPEADGGHAGDLAAVVHQVDAAVVGAEHGRVDLHRRVESPAVEAHVPDAARARVLHLHLEHRVAAAGRRAGVDGIHLDARRAAALAVWSCGSYE